MTTNATARRLRRVAEAYARDTRGMTLRRITNDEVLTMELRADGYSNAHVEGEHESNGLCSFTGKMAARDCGELGAAAEFVETTDGLSATPKPVAATNRGDRAAMTHRGCDHANTKAERAKCRRAIYALRAEMSAELSAKKEN